MGQLFKPVLQRIELTGAIPSQKRGPDQQVRECGVFGQNRAVAVGAEGIFKPVWSEEGTLCYVRKFKEHELLVALNRSGLPRCGKDSLIWLYSRFF